eukprot:395140_1
MSMPKKRKKDTLSDSSSSTSSITRKKNKNQRKYIRDKKNVSPSPSFKPNKNKSHGVPSMELIPKRKTSHFIASSSSSKSNHRRPRSEANGNSQPPNKKRKIGAMSDIGNVGNIRRSVSNTIKPKRYVAQGGGDAFVSPSRKRKRAVINDDSSDEDDGRHRPIQKTRQKQQNKAMAKSPTRSESSVSNDYDEDEDEEEDSLANRYSTPSRKKRT